MLNSVKLLAVQTIQIRLENDLIALPVVFWRGVQRQTPTLTIRLGPKIGYR